MLKWSPANAKTRNLELVAAIKRYLKAQGKAKRGRKVYSLDLLSGFSCPMAHECLSKAIVKDGKRSIQDGKHTKFRCFSASQEVLYPAVYNSRKYNYDMLKGLRTATNMAAVIHHSMPKNLGVCRIHVAGDFFHQSYFDAWVKVAQDNPDRLFYAYTKNLPVWLKRRHIVEQLDNLVLTASYGGRQDHLIESEALRYAKVVFSEGQAIASGLEIDHDDSHAADPSKRHNSFALLIHGVQPKGSEASTALSALKGKGRYTR